MGLLDKLAQMRLEKETKGMDIKKLPASEQLLYEYCIRQFIREKRELLEHEEPELEALTEDDFVENIIELIHDGDYCAYIADKDNYVIMFINQDEGKIMHYVEEGQTKI